MESKTKPRIDHTEELVEDAIPHQFEHFWVENEKRFRIVMSHDGLIEKFAIDSVVVVTYVADEDTFQYIKLVRAASEAELISVALRIPITT